MRDYGQKTILCIDDDRDILNNIKQILEMEGYKIITATNGFDALEMLDRLADFQLPDLIMLDYLMPVLNGDQFNKKRLSIPRLKNIPVVMMTASGDLKKFMNEVEAEAYISKPMDIDNILNVAQNFTYRRSAAQTAFLA